MMQAALRRWTGLAAVLAALLGVVGAAQAGGENTGFYAGVSGTVLIIEGTGSWMDIDFDIRQPLGDGSAGSIGLNWDERLLFGARPMIGYRLSERFAVQAAYSYLLPKSSAQIYSEVQNNSNYEQRLDVEWKQRSVEAFAAFYPVQDWDAYLYCGVDWVRIGSDVIFAESLEYASIGDQWVTNGQSSTVDDSVTALGLLVGAGIELPSEDLTFAPFFAIQYSTAETDEPFFGSDEFRVKVGGVSFLGGLKWYFSMD